jgi:SWI/SNF-related matrix-associated actin-dependent regulator 1 of chromatin subfamily A
MNLYPHQQTAKEFLLAKKRCILADQPRVGKTAPTVAASIEHQPVLVVCPAVAKRVWQRAFEAFGIEAQVINGRKAVADLVPGAVAIVNYDVLHNITAIKGWQTLVLDESHRIKNHTAKRTKTALKLMKATERVYCLSGTPIPNRPIEIWTTLHGLGIYKASWLNFAYTYCKAWQSPWGLDVSGAANLAELKTKMQPYVLRRKREDVFLNYQQPVVQLVELDLPVDKREKQFDADALVVNPNLVLALEGLSEIMRESGMRKVPDAVDFISGKLNDEADESFVVFCWHKDVAQLLYGGLALHKPVMIVGDTPAHERQQAIDDFQSGKARVMVGNISSLGEGVDLSRANTVIFVESTWATSALEQASARVENINKQGQAPMIYILTIRNSLDHLILSKVIEKSSVIEQIV